MTREEFNSVVELSRLYFLIIYKDRILSKITEPQHVRLGNILVWTHTLFMPLSCIVLDDNDNIIDGYWCGGVDEYRNTPVSDYEQVTKHEDL